MFLLSRHAPARPRIESMQSETHHDVYRTWAELAEAAKTDEKAWLFLVNFAPWATRLLEEPTRH